jgi:hypothetical protein
LYRKNFNDKRKENNLKNIHKLRFFHNNFRFFFCFHFKSFSRSNSGLCSEELLFTIIGLIKIGLADIVKYVHHFMMDLYDCIFFFSLFELSNILNASSKNTENALIVCLQKETTRYFLKTRAYVVYLVLSLVFKTVFGFFLAILNSLK